MKARIHPSLFLSLLLVITAVCKSHAAIPLDEVNRLVADGQYQRAGEKLDAARVGASQDELQIIERMIGQLATFIEGRRSLPTPADTSNPEFYAITHLGGYKGGWLAVAAWKSHYSEQVISGFQEKWPKEWIDRHSALGFRVTAVSGDQQGWCVVMSKRKDRRTPEQIILGPGPMDDGMDASMHLKFSENFRVTSVGGFLDDWVLVMEKDTGWDWQQFVMKPTSRSREELHEWWRQRVNDDYCITAMNGNFWRRPSTGESGSSFVLVATRGLEIDLQQLEIGVEFPAKGTINTDQPVHMMAGYGKNNLLVLRGGFPFIGQHNLCLKAADFEDIRVSLEQASERRRTEESGNRNDP